MCKVRTKNSKNINAKLKFVFYIHLILPIPCNIENINVISKVKKLPMLTLALIDSPCNLVLLLLFTDPLVTNKWLVLEGKGGIVIVCFVGNKVRD